MCAAQFYPVATFFFGSGPAKVQSQTLLALSSTSHGACSLPAPKKTLLTVCQVPGSSLKLWTTFSDGFKFSADTMGVGLSSYSVEMYTLGSSSMLSIFVRWDCIVETAGQLVEPWSIKMYLSYPCRGDRIRGKSLHQLSDNWHPSLLPLSFVDGRAYFSEGHIMDRGFRVMSKRVRK
ncbi:hypothetical protein EDD18DRAFT_1139346 [Armillaria luteobubalina]|uniref:Uncharacterized protein n=1 Tax=Armillaria luteobubalina TaxID=153913 RepID=A0AA39UT65_9AGAR|nr:hypothetical protein EDD18DRAFT_1139346 [Armillaria luteobubalina]